MNCNPSNPCMGVYGKCLDVKITNACNGNCAFCIERGGHEPDPVSVNSLIDATNSLTDYKKVLILGGEPFLYPHLEEYIDGISGKEIYITTNGSMLDPAIISRIAPRIKAINISIHHYDERKNDEIVGTHVSFANIIQATRILNKANCDIRINANLIKGYIDSITKAENMAARAIALGAGEIRFAELQNCPELYIDSSDIFTDAHANPFCEGCDHEIKILGGVIKARLRQTCGIVNPRKDRPISMSKRDSRTKVLYPDSNVSDGWKSSGDSCHGRHNSSGDSCHPGRFHGQDSCH